MLIVRNNSSFSVSIASNTNRLVSSSNDNFGGCRPGTYIKLGDEDNLYSIFKTSNFFYIKDFELFNSKTLRVLENTEINLQPEDTIKIIYDEYELNSVLNIKDGGKFYNQNDILTVIGGELSIDIREGFGYPTKLKVEEVDDNGKITKLSLLNKGKYIVYPTGEIEVNSTSGLNAKLELKYSIIDARAILNRVIKSIQFKNNETYLELDYSLPLGIKQGKLSVEKWEIILNNTFLNPTQYGIKYKMFKDFTPELNLPLLAKGSNCFEILYNESMIKLDSKIKEIENKIKIISS